MTDIWQAGKTYVPGSLVKPSSTTVVAQPQPTNGNFTTGDLTGWTQAGSRFVIATDTPYSGTYFVRCSGTGVESLNNTNAVPVSPGQHITAQAAAKLTNNGTDDQGAQVIIVWLNAADAEIGTALGSLISGVGGSWKITTASGTAPPLTASAFIRLNASNGTHGGTVEYDAVSWDYAYQSPPTGLIFKATQAAPGKSGSTEPTWPTSTGIPVTDNQVTWEGVIASRVVWEASPIMKTGDTEPTWPLVAGAVVHDGNMDWITVTSQITDPKCPQSKVVAIMASKVFAADKDIVRFSATVNPLDWSSAQDAGYLPTGLQQANANDMAVLAPYRSNLTAFNASSFQNWQVDPDPAAMSILDQMDGIGSSAQHAAQPVGNDLFYLSQLGVRSVSIAAGTDSLSAGDVGMPVDVLVQPAAKLDTTTLGPRSSYYPSAGQYWLAFDAPTDAGGPQVFVFTLNGGKGKWSRYIFPFAVDAFAQLGNDLYIRHGDEVSIVSEDAVTDDVAGVPTNFTGLAQWAWLDNGQPGVTKMLESLDYVGTGQGPSLSIGYDQRDPNAFTDPYLIDPDTLPGDPIPIPVAAPTFSIKLQFAGGAAWSVNAVTLHLSNMAGNP
ncbi:hypothetical protein EAH88_11865 [Rhodanobacter glycinis]|uniref:Uncharacterized protein n=1 Tax=Rhodanobacter glycinis TaxID=582702 RepID=A0A502C6I7_9GAMM|nr:hypothetical protein [Rhodanobacter glycinis]TPG08320.1 hypothetical protein EAH88_11865 [Rhodanobacter glycinis]